VPASIAQVIAGEKLWHVEKSDALDLLMAIGPMGAQHIICDPPYDARTHERARSLKDGGSNIDIHFNPLSDFSFVPVMLDVAQRWVIAFCALEQLGDYKKAAGEEAWTRAGVWVRTNGTPQISGDRPAQGGEGIAIMHSTRTKRAWNGGGSRGTWTCGIEKQDRHHVTQKPLDLMLELILAFTEPGELVVDPFCGSGTTGVACLRTGRRFIGADIDPQYAEMATARLQAEESQVTLSAVRSGQIPLFDLSSTKARNVRRRPT
jgi:site-specific DNA-methyltransferase (adenine-specific)